MDRRFISVIPLTYIFAKVFVSYHEVFKFDILYVNYSIGEQKQTGLSANILRGRSRRRPQNLSNK